VRHILPSAGTNRDALVLDARFIGDAVDDVLNRLIETTLVRDRDSVAWRAERPHEVVLSAARRPVGTASGAPCVGRD
jgi:hypothetical protein